MMIISSLKIKKSRANGNLALGLLFLFCLAFSETAGIDCSQYQEVATYTDFPATLSYVVNPSNETGGGTLSGQVVYEGTYVIKECAVILVITLVFRFQITNFGTPIFVPQLAGIGWIGFGINHEKQMIGSIAIM